MIYDQFSSVAQQRGMNLSEKHFQLFSKGN